MKTLIEIYTTVASFARKANQTVGKKNDYYITLAQLELIFKDYT